MCLRQKISSLKATDSQVKFLKGNFLDVLFEMMAYFVKIETEVNRYSSMVDHKRTTSVTDHA